MDYKRALREAAEKESVEAGEPAVVGARGDGDGAGAIAAGQPAPYMPGDSDHGTSETGEAGQYEDAAVAAERAGQAAREAGADPAKEAGAAAEGAEEVLPRHG